MDRRRKLAALLLRLVLGATFVYAALPKIGDPAAFALIIYGYDLFPHAMINLSAIMVPFVELVAGACLIAGFFKRSALLIINSLLLFFIVIITINLVRGHQFDCGCFSVAEAHAAASAAWLLVRDLVLFGCGIVLWILFSASSNSGNSLKNRRMSVV